jgi:2-polyprenyl-3-methyl-5-hydroxy-6-metoxy-1,4-benzoquinol methylase
VAGCCSTDYRRMFNRRFAERDARAFRSRGLRGSSRALVELAGDVRGQTVLDVGGGIGGISLELLAAGAERATTVEISGAYEDAARALATERGVAGRIDRVVADFVEEGDAVAVHDVVVMHRVVCCYPDVDALMLAASGHVRRVLVLTYPQERAFIRLGLAVVNAFLGLRHCGFRVHVHPVARILDGGRGLRVERRERHGLLWESAALVR